MFKMSFSGATIKYNKMSGNVLIGGGTGFIGTQLVNILKSKGYGSIIVSRMPGPQNMSWTDLSKNGIPAKVVAVVNLAGQNVLDPTRRWTDGFKQNVWTSRVNTTSALAEAINQAQEKPNVFVSISGVGFYPPSTTAKYDEESDIKGDDFLARLCHAWESATQVAGKHPVRTVIIRSGVVLGKNGGMIKQLWLPFYLGLGGPIASGTQFLPWIHVEDIAQLIVHSVENEKVNGVLNGVAPEIVTNSQFSSTLAKAMWRPCLFPLPETIVNLAFSKERAKIMTEGQKVIPKRTLETGFKYKYPNIIEACNALVNEK